MTEQNMYDDQSPATEKKINLIKRLSVQKDYAIRDLTGMTNATAKRLIYKLNQMPDVKKQQFELATPNQKRKLLDLIDQGLCHLSPERVDTITARGASRVLYAIMHAQNQHETGE